MIRAFLNLFRKSLDDRGDDLADWANAASGTGLSQVEPASGLAGFATSIPFAEPYGDVPHVPSGIGD